MSKFHEVELFSEKRMEVKIKTDFLAAPGLFAGYDLVEKRNALLFAGRFV